MPNVGYATLQVIPSVRGIANELRQQLVGPAQQAGEQAGEESGSGFRDAFKGVLAALGVEAIAEKAGEVFSEAFSSAIEQGNITGRLQAQLGATPQDAARYGKLAGKLYSSGVTDSFEDAADVIRNVAQGGLVPPKATNDQLQSIATKASDVASTFGADFESVVNGASQLIAGGLVKNAAAAFDLITVGYQKLGPKADDLLDTINEYSPQFSKMGLDGKTALGIIFQAVKGGARDTDNVADTLKEFSLRAVDGSATTSAAFKTLGINAKQFTTEFTKGGDSAQGALDLVFDKLRTLKGAEWQNTVTALFGGPGEDLGAAINSIDVSGAVSQLGDLDGAADQVGKDIRSGPSYELTVFKRTVEQGLVNFLGSKVVPVLARWGKVFNDDVLPPLETVGGVIDRDLFPALGAARDVVVGTYRWFKKWGLYLLPLAVLIGGVTLALSAEAIAVGAVNVVFGIYRGLILAATAVTEGYAAAQAVLNSVMALNPIVLVVIALAALAAALFVAYQKSETFRDIVQGVWTIIKGGAQILFDWITGTFVPIFTRTIPNAFGAVLGWVKGHWPLIVGLLLGPIGLAVGAIYQYRDKIKGAFQAAWSWIKAHTITPMGTFFTKILPGWATSAVSGFGREWDKLEARAKSPINFVINTVYNKGIVGVWNRVAGAFGAPKLGTFKFAGGGPVFGAGTETSDDVPAWLSRGEHVWTAREVRGAGGHGAVAAMRAWAARGGGSGSPGFFLGGALDWVGKGANAVAGVGSAAWGKVKKVASWLKGTLAASARAGVRAVVNPLLGQIPGLDTQYGQMIKRLPEHMIDALFGYADRADKQGASTIAAAGGGQVGRWITQAIQATGVPATWAGPLRTLVMRESGGNPRAINLSDINAQNGDPSRGLAQTIGATFEHYRLRSLPDDIYNPVANLAAAIRYIQSRYGDISRVQQADASKPPKGYDSGGWLPPGATMAVNATGQPEAVLTASQWQAVAAAAAAAQAVAAGASRYQPAAQQQPVIYLNAAGLDRGLVQWLQRAIRNEAGGSVQVYLGTGKG
jgi:SLT domain-containing protein